MSQRFRRVIAQPGGDRNPCVTVDHKGIMCVVDDSGKFHLQNSIELLNDGTDVKLVSPCHSGSPSPWRFLISIILPVFDRPATSEWPRPAVPGWREQSATTRWWTARLGIVRNRLLDRRGS